MSATKFWPINGTCSYVPGSNLQTQIKGQSAIPGRRVRIQTQIKSDLAMSPLNNYLSSTANEVKIDS